MRSPAFSDLSDWRCALALGLGSGLAPKAPGTFGTVAGLVLFLPFLGMDWRWLLAGIVVASVLGIGFCEHCSIRLGTHDHGAIVWDEFVGIWITLLVAGTDWRMIIGAFVLFRLFDILKPWPISWCDKNVHGGLGIMLDDIIAGIAAAAVLYGIQIWVM